MEKTRRILLAEMATALVLAAIIVVIYECGVLMPGVISPDDGKTLFVATTVMELLTIGCIPLALYLFRIPLVHRQLTAGATTAPRRLLLWGTVRLSLLCIPLVANVLLYYLLSLTVSFAYMTIILALCLFMVYPSQGRCVAETTMEEKA